MTKKDLRQTVHTEPSQNELETFQNDILRPILKLQHEIIIETFEAFLAKRKQQIAQRSIPERKEFIQKAIQKDLQLKYLLLGQVIGLLEVEELKEYNKTSTELNKRIFGMLIKRIESVYCS